MRRIIHMCEEMKKKQIEPIVAGLIFLGLSMASFHGADGILWVQPLPWLLLGISAGLWRAHSWARWLAMVVLAALLVVIAWSGGAEFQSVRSLLVEPWLAAELEQRTGLHPTLGGTLVTAGLLLWLMSPPVRRAFALSDLDAVRNDLPALHEGRSGQVRDDH
jgi:hypothetical protein